MKKGCLYRRGEKGGTDACGRGYPRSWNVKVMMANKQTNKQTNEQTNKQGVIYVNRVEVLELNPPPRCGQRGSLRTLLAHGAVSRLPR